MHFGIDLGTTNSLISVFEDGKPRLIGAEGPLVPSVVSVDKRNILVGAAAKDRLVTKPQETAAAFKRAMGTERVFKLGKSKFSAVDLSALVLKSLKTKAEAETGQTVHDVVISVPAYFNQLQRAAVRAAAIAADLNPVRLINEPTSAALAYGLQDIEEQGHILVFDLGGGTFDVSIVEVFEGVIEVKATSGDAQLGGEDFTRVVYEHLGAKHGYDRGGLTEQALYRQAAETLKRALAQSEEASCTIVIGKEEKHLTLSRETFAELTAPLMQRLRHPVERAIHDAKITRDEIDRIVMVGGATRMPAIRSFISRLTGRMPQIGIDPDHVVALGASVQAALFADDIALDDVVMTDVSAFSLGFAVARRFGNHVEEGYFIPLIERNTTIPASREEIFSTTQLGQTKLTLELYQGESPRVADNVKLGDLSLSIPRNRKNHERVRVRLSYDTSGLIEVDTTVLSTGFSKTTVMTQLTGGLSDDDLATRRKALAKLKFHPKDEEPNIALIARLERCYAMALSDDRIQLSEMLAHFQDALRRQIPSEIEEIRSDISDALDGFEDGYVR